MFGFIKKFFNLFSRTDSPDTLYVGNLVYSISVSELKGTFSEFGYITSARIIRDVRTKRSKGYGFVTYKSAKSAQQALAMEGEYVKGRPIKVRFAHSKPQAYDD